MTDSLLTVPDQEEALSRVYVKAVAARAGYGTAHPVPDRDSVDLRIHAGGPMRPALDLQLKAAVTVEGNLKRSGQRRYLLNPRIVNVISTGDAPDDSA